MLIRQSDLKTWQRCPLQWRFANVDRLPREQSSALTFGTLIHEAVLRLETTQNLPGTLQWFRDAWANPEAVDPELRIDYFLPRTSYTSLLRDGERMLTDWWDIVQWEGDVVLGREYQFTVPIGDHHLTGTVDKLALRYLPKEETTGVLIADYKTNSKPPTYNYLRHDLQFTAYTYATTCPEFWTGIENGQALYAQHVDAPRRGEWVALRGPKRMDAGERTQIDFNRLRYAVDQVAAAIAMGIYVPNISGESCRYCDFRKACGLPDIEVEQAAA